MSKEIEEKKIYNPRPKEKAYEYVMSYIKKNNLKAFDSLPPERKICEMWNINRVTLRSAILQLIDSGVLFSVQGSATRVSPKFVRTLQDLQSFTEYAKSQNLTSKNELLSFSVVECDKHLAGVFKRTLGEKVYKISRLRSLNDIPVLIETAYIPISIAPGLDEHDLVKGSLFSVLKNVYDLNISHGTEKVSITFATEDESTYLKINEGDPTYWIVSKTKDSNNNVIEYCRTVARADIVEMRSVVHWSNSKDGGEF